MDDEEIDVELIKFIKKCQIKKKRRLEWIRLNEEWMTKSIKLHQEYRIKKVDAISAHCSKVLNEEWITKMC